MAMIRVVFDEKFLGAKVGGTGVWLGIERLRKAENRLSFGGLSWLTTR